MFNYAPYSVEKLDNNTPIKSIHACNHFRLNAHSEYQLLMCTSGNKLVTLLEILALNQ